MRGNVVIGPWSPWEGKFSTEQTPQVVEPLRRLGARGPKEVNLEAAAAGGKSTVGEGFLAWLIVNAPGFTAWYAQDEEAAKEFAETRINRFLDSCAAVAALAPPSRHSKRTQAIHFPHMSFVAQAANQGNAQSKHIRHLIMDEPWLYKPGMMSQLRKRTNRYAHNRTILAMSTGSLDGDEFAQAWQRGSRQSWQLFCPTCEQHHTPEWTFGEGKPGGVNWSKDAKREDGTWDMRLVKETTVYQCPLCGTDYAATAANAFALNSRGKYSDPHPDAMPNHYSFHWDSMCSDFAQLGDIAVEYLEAKAAVKRGTTKLLQDFTQKRLAKPWKEEPPEINLGSLDSSYLMADPWTEGEATLMAVDCQDTHFWAVVRRVAKGSRSRLVAAARLATWESVRAFQLSHAVNDDCVVVDSGHRADDVYTHCAFYGWIAIKGEAVPGGYRQRLPDGTDGFLVARASADANGRPFQYYPAQRLPGSKQEHCALILVSDEMSSEILSRCRSGKVAGWTLARDTPEEYRKQFATMQRMSRQHKLTGQVIWFWKEIGKAGNHLWDCERYLLAAMFMTGYFHIAEHAGKQETAAT